MDRETSERQLVASSGTFRSSGVRGWSAGLFPLGCTPGGRAGLKMGSRPRRSNWLRARPICRPSCRRWFSLRTARRASTGPGVAALQRARRRTGTCRRRPRSSEDGGRGGRHERRPHIRRRPDAAVLATNSPRCSSGLAHMRCCIRGRRAPCPHELPHVTSRNGSARSALDVAIRWREAAMYTSSRHALLRASSASRASWIVWAVTVDRRPSRSEQRWLARMSGSTRGVTVDALTSRVRPHLETAPAPAPRRVHACPAVPEGDGLPADARPGIGSARQHQ